MDALKRLALELLAVASCLAVADSAFAQASFTVGTNLADISRLNGNETDPSIAIQPGGPSNMFVAAATDGVNGGLFIARSTNSGASWSTNLIATNGDPILLPAAGEPSVAWDTFSNLFVAYLPVSDEGVAIVVSTNGGETFAALTNLAVLDSTDTPRITSPALGAAAGSLWIVYKDFTLANTPLVVQGLQSTGLGTNGGFGPAEFLPDSGDGGFPDIVAGPAGQVMVAFQGNLFGSGNSPLYICVNTNAVSTNGLGTNFLAPVVAASDAIGGHTYIEAENTGIGLNATAGVAWDSFIMETNYGKAYLVYTALTTNGNLVINSCFSTNSGATWSAAAQVNDDLTGTNDHFLPRMAVDPASGIVGFSWWDCRSDLGSATPPTIVTFMTNFTFNGVLVSNIAVTSASGIEDVTNTIVDNSGGNMTNWTVTISADEFNGTLFTSNANHIYIYGPATNFTISLTTISATNPPASTQVTILGTNVFPYTFTDLTNANRQAIAYTTLSLDGASTFLPNQPLISSNRTIKPPSVGYASDVYTAGDLIGWGHYMALAAYGASFYPIWQDNSDTLTNNPNGALSSFDLYDLAGGGINGSVTVPTADVSVVVTGPPLVPSDENLTFKVVVRNNGPSTVTNAVLTNTLGTNVTLGDVTPALGASYADFSSNLVFYMPVMKSGTALTNVFRVTATSFSAVSNFASVLGPLTDLVLTNNTNMLIVPVAGEDLALGMTTSETNVLIGDTVSNWITVTNIGVATNGPVFVTNTYSPNWTNFTVQAPGSYYITNNSANTMVVLNLGLLPTNQPVTCVLTATMLSVGSSATVESFVTSQDVDTNLANNSATINYFVNGEDLAIGLFTPQSVDLGEPFLFAISVTNFGPSETGLVSVTSEFSTNLAIISANLSQGDATISTNASTGLIEFNLGSINAGQVATMTVSAEAATGPSSASIFSSVAGTDFDPNFGNNEAANNLVIQGEDLGVAISAYPAVVQMGQAVTFTETVTNLGPSANGIVLVTNSLSTNLGQIVVLQPTNRYTTNASEVVFNLGAIAAQQSVQIEFTATALKTGAGVISAGVGSLDFDTDPTNNAAQVSVTITRSQPMISNIVVTAAASGVFLAFQTGELATAQVYYGLTTNYGSLTTVSVTPATNHLFLLTGLAPGSNYNFKVMAWVGQTLYTTNSVFTTIDSLILNTADASYTGLWSADFVGTGTYGTYSQDTPTVKGTPTAWAAYAPLIPFSGKYDVSIWYPVSSVFTTNARVYLSGATNGLVIGVNESTNGGSWQLLATNLFFAIGTGGNVTIYNNTGETDAKTVVANAMKWFYDPSQDYSTNGTVPGWWADFYFGPNAVVDGSADPDGDGYSTYAEYVFGTDPTDPASHLSFSIHYGPGDVVTFAFSPWQGGRAYQLQSATDLATGAWDTLSNTVSVTTNGTGVFTVTQPNPAGSFYRLSAQILPQ